MSELEINEGANGDDFAVVDDDVRALIGQVADLRAEAKKDHHLDLAIPGTRQMLWARYRPFPAAKTEKRTGELRRAAERGQPILLAAACDTLVDACEQIMLLQPKFNGEIGAEGENLIPIDDTLPIGYEERLADLFVKNADERAAIKTARHVVLAMFPTEQSVLQQNVEVSNWMIDVTRETDQNLLGN